LGFTGLYDSFGLVGLAHKRTRNPPKHFLNPSDFIFKSTLTQRSKLNKLFKLSDWPDRTQEAEDRRIRRWEDEKLREYDAKPGKAN